MPKISIIVPVYKVEQYLSRCIESILAQTFTDFELILVDDGSPDRCPQICDEYGKRDKRIKVIHKENGGLSDARNTGIDIATGEFIAFVDSDDWIVNDIYEYALKIQEQYNADIVEFRKKRVKSEQEAIIEKEKDEKGQVILSSGLDMLPRIHQDKIEGNIAVWNKLFRRSIFDTLRFEVGRIYEDTLLMPHVFFIANIYVFCDKIGYFYFQGNRNSITHRDFDEKSLDLLYAYRSNRQFFIDHELKEALYWLDTTFAFTLINDMKKIGYKYGKDNIKYKEIKKEYSFHFKEFLSNPYFIWKQKLLLIYYFIFL